LKSPKKKPEKKTRKEPVRVAQGIEQLGGLLTEMCRLYRATRRKEVTAGDGYKLMRMLAEIRTSISTHDIEDRLAALEQAEHRR
jgi:hypothetical protein